MKCREGAREEKKSARAKTKEGEAGSILVEGICNTSFSPRGIHTFVHSRCYDSTEVGVMLIIHTVMPGWLT